MQTLSQKEQPAARNEGAAYMVEENTQVEICRSRIDDLHQAMLTMPQAPGMDTDHFFAGGMYCRRIKIPAGVTIVSKVHKTEHLFIGCSGELHVAGQGENYIIRSGDVIPSPIGTKRAVHALSDVVVMTVHRTDQLSTDNLEQELMEVDELSLYDINNKPKSGVLSYENSPQLEEDK